MGEEPSGARVHLDSEPIKGTPSGGMPYVPALDGIRAVAVSGVLLFHGGVSWVGGGFLGVSTFFTLSGFLITRLLLNEHEATGGIDLSRFWTRRFRRLMPASLLALLAIAFYGGLGAEPHELWRLRGDAISALLYGSNWWFHFSGKAYEELFARPSPVQHFWSLSIEEQFYLLYPPLLLVILWIARGRRGLVGCALALLTAGSVAASALLHEPEASTSRVYYGTDTRAAELLVGALLAVAMRPGGLGCRFRPTIEAAGWVGLAASLAIWALASPSSGWLFEGGLLVHALLVSLWIRAALQSGPLARTLAWEPLRRLGLVSYGAYLYHWPLYVWLDEARTGLEGPGLLAMRIGATVVAASLSYRLLEHPIRNGTRLRGRSLWAVAPFAVGFVALALVAVTRNPVVPPSVQHPFLGRAAMPLDVGDDAAKPRIAVLGDSVAWTLGQGLARWGRSSGEANVWNLASFGCGVTHSIGALNRQGHPAGQRCGRAADWWAIPLASFKPDVVLVMVGLWDLRDRQLPQWSATRGPGDPLFDRWLLGELSEALAAAKETGAEVQWLTYPCISPRPGQNVAKGPLGDTAALDPERLRHLNVELLGRLLAAHPGAFELYDLTEHVCRAGRFDATVLGVRHARPDGVHFSTEAADRIAAELLGPAALRIARPRQPTHP